jgi:hypothetical protein
MPRNFAASAGVAHPSRTTEASAAVALAEDNFGRFYLRAVRWLLFTDTRRLGIGATAR